MIFLIFSLADLNQNVVGENVNLGVLHLWSIISDKFITLHLIFCSCKVFSISCFKSLWLGALAIIISGLSSASCSGEYIVQV